jgi:hypothetical protein
VLLLLTHCSHADIYREGVHCKQRAAALDKLQQLYIYSVPIAAARVLDQTRFASFSNAILRLHSSAITRFVCISNDMHLQLVKVVTGLKHTKCMIYLKFLMLLT